MERPAVCERCGLRVVRRELERSGVIMRFCDECYWGEAESEGAPEEHTKSAEPAQDSVPPKA